MTGEIFLSNTYLYGDVIDELRYRVDDKVIIWGFGGITHPRYRAGQSIIVCGGNNRLV